MTILSSINFEDRDGRGTRGRKQLLLSTSIALEELWILLGGVMVVARELDIPYQMLINWRITGHVPYKRVGPISRKLKVDPRILNYKLVRTFTNNKTPWETVVRQTFPPESADRILKGEHPE